MKKITLLKSLFIVVAMCFFSVVALAQATTVGTYKKVTAAPANGDWSGQYIVTNADASKVFNCSLKGGNGEVPTYVKNSSGGFIVSSDKSTIEVTQALVDANLAANDGYKDATGSFHITIDKDGYIKAACGYYIGAKPNSSKTGVTTGISYIAEVGENEGFKHTITLKADGSVLLNAKINNKNGYLQAYSVNFQYYTSSSKGAICLYKLETADGGEGGETALAAPTASVESGDYLEAFDLTLACATEGATIKYKLNGGEEQTYSASAPIRISATTTLVVWAEKDGAKSEEVTFTYNLPTEVANIAAFIADESGKQVRIASTMTVVYVRTSYLYVKDESGYMLVNGKVNSKNPSYKVGDQFTGLVGKAKVVNGIKEITPANFPTATATGVAVEPEVVAMGNITTAIAHKYIVLEELATLVSKAQWGPIVASIAGKEYTMPDRFTLFVNGWKFVAGDMLKITAFVGFDANGNVELYPTAVEKEVVPVAPEAPVFTPAAGDYYDSVIVSISCATTENVMIKYAFGGTEPTGKSATYTEPFKLTTNTVVSAMAFLIDANGNPVEDAEGKPFASPAVFAEYKVTPYVAPEAPATPTIQYEGGYFASEALEVALASKETRPNNILVTVDGSEPLFGATATQTLSSVTLSGTTTVKVRAILMTEEGKPYQTPKGEYIYSEVASATFTKVEAPAAPVFTPAAGDYYDSVIVSISCATTENVMIKYAFGGTEPTGKSATYTEPFKLTTNTVVSAMAFLIDANGNPVEDAEGKPFASPAVFAEYKVTPYVAPEAPATPTIQYEGGYFASEALEVALASKETRPNNILVTVDGSEPLFGATATQTLSSVTLSGTTTVKVRAILMTEEGQPYQTPAGDYIYSDVVTATFTKVEAPATPVFTPEAGEYYDSVEVSIACATENVMIKYEFGGTEPTGSSMTYTEPFKLFENTVVSAVAYLTNAEGDPIFDVEELPIASEAVFTEYVIKETILPPVAPVFSPEAGEFIDSVVVTLACETENTDILYDLLGLQPNFTSPRFEEPIIIRETTTISAMAVLVDEEGEVILNEEEMPYMSELVTATYVVKPGEIVGVEDVELVAVVYAKGGMIYVDTELGNMIEVFTVQGQCIYSAEATSELTSIDAINADVLLVKVNDQVIKVAIK